MDFESLTCIMNICPDCKADKGAVHMEYIGYKTVCFKLHVYYACTVCCNHFEYVLHGPVRLKDKPL